MRSGGVVSLWLGSVTNTDKIWSFDPHNLYMLGITANKVSFFFFPSVFTKANCPFTLVLYLLLERRTRDRKVASSNPGRNGGRMFFSGVSFVCWLLFGVRSTPVLPQWHVKDPGSAGSRLYLNTHTPLTHRSRSGLAMPLSRQSVGIYQETSSHATRQGAFGYSRLSLLSHCGLILA